VIEAINAREQPKFTDSADEMVYAVARELLATGSLGDDIFKAAESTLGYPRLADVVGVIGHFSTTAMMANVLSAPNPRRTRRRTSSGKRGVFSSVPVSRALMRPLAN
jgi:hypothetical protein